MAQEKKGTPKLFRVTKLAKHVLKVEFRRSSQLWEKVNPNQLTNVIWAAYPGCLDDSAA